MSASKIKVNTTVPIFLWKLWVLLNDEQNYNYIRWSQSGDSFFVIDESNFSKKLLPLYFKHNNFASFVRQLNLYGFRKVIEVQQGIINIAEAEQFEFQHPFFKRGRQDLIEQIRRKLNQSSRKSKVEDLQNTCTHVQTVADSHREISSQLSLLRDSNERIWSELLLLREQHDRQSKVLDRLISFFASVFRPYNSGLSNMLVNNLLQDGETSSNNYNHVMSTLANITSFNNTNDATTNTAVVPISEGANCMPNLSFNNNALAALTFNMTPTKEQSNDTKTIYNDPFYALNTSNEASFQELPPSVANITPSVPINNTSCIVDNATNTNNTNTASIPLKHDDISNLTRKSHIPSDNKLTNLNSNSMLTNPTNMLTNLNSNSMLTNQNSTNMLTNLNSTNMLTNLNSTNSMLTNLNSTNMLTNLNSNNSMLTNLNSTNSMLTNLNSTNSMLTSQNSNNMLTNQNSNNMLANQNSDISTNFANFTPLLPSNLPEDRDSSGFGLAIIPQMENKVIPPQKTELNATNKFEALVDDCRALDQELLTIQDFLTYQNIDELNKDDVNKKE